jgi:hypothetical protein
MQESGSDELSFLTQRGYILSLWGLICFLCKGEIMNIEKEISDENQKKVTDLENEVRGLKVTVEKKEHAIKALRKEKDDCFNR